MSKKKQAKQQDDIKTKPVVNRPVVDLSRPIVKPVPVPVLEKKPVEKPVKAKPTGIQRPWYVNEFIWNKMTEEEKKAHI